MDNEKVCVFIMPRSSRAWAGAEALWITAAGWSAAAQRRFGKAWVVTTDRIATPQEVLHYPLGKTSAVVSGKKGKWSWMPLFFKTFVKDILLWKQTRNWNVINQKPWSNSDVAFVWQQHDLFSGPGRKLADELCVPLVTYVHAPVVWEAHKWGVKRYLWGWFLERFVEAPALKKSDLVACVSDEVAQKLESMGVERSRIMVSPMAVDPYLFQDHQDPKLRNKLSLDNSLVIGWTGSFRSFHGLDHVVKAFADVHRHFSETKLLLVGDGSEREGIQQLVTDLKLNDAVVFAGRQPFASIPAYVSLFDIALVSARSAEGFHYSPLKLREYLAAGKPVLAPRAGEIPQLFRDEYHLKLYTAGNTEELADKLKELIKNKKVASTLAANGRKAALESSTWDVEVKKTIGRLPA
jgi:glycosyltransferase involved in cell wall biosynthesis